PFRQPPHVNGPSIRDRPQPHHCGCQLGSTRDRAANSLSACHGMRRLLPIFANGNSPLSMRLYTVLRPTARNSSACRMLASPSRVADSAVCMLVILLLPSNLDVGG